MTKLHKIIFWTILTAFSISAAGAVTSLGYTLGQLEIDRAKASQYKAEWELKKMELDVNAEDFLTMSGFEPTYCHPQTNYERCWGK